MPKRERPPTPHSLKIFWAVFVDIGASTVNKGNIPIGELELVRGDDYFPLQQIDQIDIMKIGVEGFERFALQGLRDTVARTRPIIVCEMTYGKELSFTDLDEFRMNLPANYRLYTFDKRKQDGSKARCAIQTHRRTPYYSLQRNVAKGSGRRHRLPEVKCDKLPLHREINA